MQGTAHMLPHNAVNHDLEYRTQKVNEKFSENIHIIANEPSLAFFRIQEHVRNTVPQLVDNKLDVQTLQNKVQGSYFDTEYAIKAVTGMEESKKHFQNIQDLLKNAMFMKQQIKYERERRKSMYRNTMMRTQTLDTTLGQSERERRSEFTQSVQLPSTTSLSQIDDSQQRVRSSSMTSQNKPGHQRSTDSRPQEGHT